MKQGSVTVYNFSYSIGEYIAVDAGRSNLSYGYAKVIGKQNSSLLSIKLYTQEDPKGTKRTISVFRVITSISKDQFKAAKLAGFPSNIPAGMLLTNQSTKIGYA